jgi:hypothetical protein
MQKRTWGILGVLGCAAGLAISVGQGKTYLGQGSSGPPAGTQRVPVIVELFTSEGCSSCPPADALLSRLETEQPIRSAEVIAIEEHVDYWDQQGWRDPFSSFEWTERQRTYAEVLRDHGVYTPEMVVDGNSGLVGSRGQESLQQIQEAASRNKVPVSVVINPSEKKNHAEVRVGVGPIAEAQNAREPAEVWLAVTESGLHSAVRGGENDGRDLYHGPVMRKLQKVGIAERGKEQAFTGTVNISLENQWNVRNLSVVAFVQEKRSRRILGAASTKLMATL